MKAETAQAEHETEGAPKVQERSTPGGPLAHASPMHIKAALANYPSLTYCTAALMLSVVPNG